MNESLIDLIRTASAWVIPCEFRPPKRFVPYYNYDNPNSSINGLFIKISSEFGNIWPPMGTPLLRCLIANFVVQENKTWMFRRDLQTWQRCTGTAITTLNIDPTRLSEKQTIDVAKVKAMLKSLPLAIIHDHKY